MGEKDNVVCVKNMYGKWHVWTSNASDNDDWPGGSTYRKYLTQEKAMKYARQIKLAAKGQLLEILELV